MTLRRRRGAATETIAAMLRGDERLKHEFLRITVPVLILHGTLAMRQHGRSAARVSRNSRRLLPRERLREYWTYWRTQSLPA